jgi:hypothetical protein
LEYVLSAAAATTVFDAATTFEVPATKPGRGRPAKQLKADREHTQVKQLAASLPATAWEQVIYRDRDNEPVRSRFAFVRMIAAQAGQ